MNATNIVEHREERPAGHGVMWREPAHPEWLILGGESPPKIPSRQIHCVTFTIPSAAEQVLLEERERAFYALVNEVEGVDEVTDLMNSLTRRIRTLDRQLAELRGGR